MIRENEILLSVNRDPLYFRFVNRARDPPCTTLIRDQTRFYFVIGFENIRIYRPRVIVIGFVEDLFFPTLESGFQNACRRKPYPEKKKCGFKNIRISADGPLKCDKLARRRHKLKPFEAPYLGGYVQASKWKFCYSFETGEDFTVGIKF